MKEKVTEEQIQEALIVRHTKVVQEKLNQARVAIAGLGGLGSNVAFFLARAGVGHLHLIDFDRVDLTNLNRQQYNIRHLNRPKPEALKEELLEINPYLDIQTDFLKIQREHIQELFQDADVICEAFDQPDQKAMLVNGVLELLPEKKMVSGSGMAGYGNSNAIQTRKAMGNLYLCGDETTGIETGKCLMAPRVAICAAHEANQILELILDE